MADPNGFLNYPRNDNPYRELAERIKDFAELQVPLSTEERQKQAARCMHCDVPFCHQGVFYGGKRAVSGCPNDNHIPEWNDLIYRGLQRKAYERLILTNPFPEFTGRVCPAPCEKSCAEALNGAGVTIKDNERFLGDLGNDEGWVAEIGKAAEPTGYKIAIIGSGPAGLSAAWRLNQLGHSVTVFEKSDRLGGLLMYGIPNMKLEKTIVERRTNLMEAEGITFRTGVNVGVDVTAKQLLEEYEAVVLACGASHPRDINVPGRDAEGIYFAVDFLKATTKSLLNSNLSDGYYISAKYKDVIVIGGGDTGNDCVGTAIRHGCKSVTQLEMMPKLPDERAANNPWPEWPRVCKTDYGQEEAIAIFGKDPRMYQTTVKQFLKNEKGQLCGVETVKLQFIKDEATGRNKMVEIPGSEVTLNADLVLIAAGFLGSEAYVTDAFGVACTPRTNVATETDHYKTNVEKVFTAGDMHRGQSLVVWAIREGREAAKEVDQYLMGYTKLR